VQPGNVRVSVVEQDLSQTSPHARSGAGKIGIVDWESGPRNFQPDVAVIDAKTDLSTQDLVTLAFRHPRGLFCGQSGSGRRCSALAVCTARCSLRLCPKPGLTPLPLRDFYIWGNQPTNATLIPHGGRACYSSDGRRSQGCGALQTLQRSYACSLCQS
jgi:hypothetical protein